MPEARAACEWHGTGPQVALSAHEATLQRCSEGHGDTAALLEGLRKPPAPHHPTQRKYGQSQSRGPAEGGVPSNASSTHESLEAQESLPITELPTGEYSCHMGVGASED